MGRCIDVLCTDRRYENGRTKPAHQPEYRRKSTDWLKATFTVFLSGALQEVTVYFR